MSHVKTALIIWSVLAIGLIIYYVWLRQHVLRIQDPRGEVYGAVALTVVTFGGLLSALVIRVVTAFLHRPAAAAAISLQISLLTGALLILMVVLSQVTAFTPAVEGPTRSRSCAPSLSTAARSGCPCAAGTEASPSCCSSPVGPEAHSW